ncbi:MAG: exodeoxyribonuclease III [Candidatus Pacebacteria bacterium]|nr:exodeoxyribonuclease III [Candidatus Paceibacterota bacterium]
MRILSWNVNGLRAFYKKGAFNSIFEVDPDIFCLQETKSHPDQLPEEVRTPAGYYAYFDHSKMRKGYSGVAIFSKEKPEKVEYSLGKPDLDKEGRMIIAYFKKFVLLNGYFPNGGVDPERLKYKLEFYDQFLKFIEKLRKQGKSVIFCGDINTAHNEIDLSRPKENSNHTGFLPIERAWIDKVIEKGYLDTFRLLHLDKIKYSWWDMKTFARDRNVGWRLDYFFVSSDLKDKIKKAEILDDMMGSDHCPVLLELK